MTPIAMSEQSTATLPSEAAADPGLNSLSAIFDAVPAPTGSEDAKTKAPAATPAPKEKKVEEPKPAEKVTPAPEKKPDAKAAPADAKKLEATPADTNAPAPADEVEKFEKDLKPNSRERFNVLAQQKAERIVAERLKTQEAPKVEETEPYKALAAERDRLQTELVKYGVENSPEYQAKFVEKPKQIREKLTSILDTYDIDTNAFFKAMENPADKANRVRLNQLMEEVGRLDAVQAGNLVQEYLEIEEARATVQNDPKLAREKLQNHEAEKTRQYVAAVAKARQAALDPLVAAFEKDPDGFFSNDEGQAEKAKIIEHVRQYAGADLEMMAPDVRAKLVMSAFLSVPLNRALAAAQAENASLRARLDKYEKGEPNLGGPTTPKGKDEDETPDLTTAVFGKR